MSSEAFANKDGVWALQNAATKERTAQAFLRVGDEALKAFENRVRQVRGWRVVFGGGVLGRRTRPNLAGGCGGGGPTESPQTTPNHHSPLPPSLLCAHRC